MDSTGGVSELNTYSHSKGNCKCINNRIARIASSVSKFFRKVNDIYVYPMDIRAKHDDELKTLMKFFKCSNEETLLAKVKDRKFNVVVGTLNNNHTNDFEWKYNWVEGGKERYKKDWMRLRRVNGRRNEELEKNIACGIDCIRRIGHVDEWNWPRGSRCFFWRWGKENYVEARDGQDIFIQDTLPKCRKKQSVPKDKETKEKVKRKIEKVRRNRYICKGDVKSLTSFFDVPKDVDDIRLVYNGTSSGLNDAVWSPWFCLPTVDSHLRAVEEGTFMGDCDIGDMFLNFMLDEKIRPYAGVDLTELFAEESNGKITWERWERLLMGFKPSPYATTREMKKIEGWLKGNKNDMKNVFRWCKVILNLPGKENYNPARPWVYLVREDGTIASDLFSYIDDYRPTGPNKRECWKACHQIGSRLTWFGIQDAARKRREPSQEPGAWAGTIIHTSNNSLTVLVSQSKWDKTKQWIDWLADSVEMGDEIEYKKLEKCRGFLIYVSRTYKSFVPYLRGIHKTIDGWRSFRNDDGWKFTSKEIEAYLLEHGEWVGAYEPGEKVKIKPRLRDDVVALKRFTNCEAPPKVLRRLKGVGVVCYGFGDASGTGFGNCITVEGKNYAKFGTWSQKYEGKHSNFKELKNLVNAVKEAVQEGLLDGVELFMFTDNAVAERAYYNGGSNKNKELDGLILDLWDIQMKSNLILHVFHVAGTRMIDSGIDGLSRGELNEGISKGIGMINFVPIHLDPLQRSPELLKWIQSWWEPECGSLHVNTPENWFDKCNEKGCFLWNIPPAAGGIAVEQLCIQTHTEPGSFHIVIIPRLCTSLWRKQLGKCVDLLITVKAESHFWPSSMHEPLILALYLPLLPPLPHFKPWRLRRTKMVDRTKSALLGMQERGDEVEWNHLRKLLHTSWKIPTMPDGLACKVLQA